MSGSFESMGWNACVLRLDFGLYSHPEEFYRMESEPMLTPSEKSPLPEAQRRIDACDAASHRTASPTHYRLNYSSPMLEVIA